MTEPSAPFRQVHHLCIVVHDIEKSTDFYTAAGIGPWHEYPPLAEYSELEVPSQEAFLAMRYRSANVDNFQIQLCQPPEIDCPQRRFLNEKGEGVFHLSFSVVDIDVAERDAKEVGLSPLMRGRRDEGSGFTFFDTLADAGVVLAIRKAANG